MKVSEYVRCEKFLCKDVRHECYFEKSKRRMIAEDIAAAMNMVR